MLMVRPKSIIWKSKRSLFFILIILALGIFSLWYFKFRVTFDPQGIPNPLVSYEFVSSRPESKLYYPNGKIFSRFGQPQRRVNEGLGVAFIGAVMTSYDPAERIYQWYSDWLIAHGWQRNEKKEAIMASGWISVKKYIKGERELFEVAMNDPKQLEWTLGKQIPKNKTVFEFSYMIR